MKAFRSLVLVVICLAFAGSAFAWNCSDPLASRVDVGTTNPGGSSGNGDGQWFLGTGSEGIVGHYYVCQKPSTPPPPTTGSQNQTQNQTQTQTQTANGGNASSTATVTGGNATGGNAKATGGSVSGSGNSTVGVNNTVGVSNQIGPISSTSGVKNSGNSSNTNTLNAQGGAGGAGGAGGQGGAGGNSNQSQSAEANNSGGNSSNVYETSSVYNAAKIPVSTAYAPTTIPTSPCLKGYSGGGQGQSLGLSFGGSKADGNCQLLELARSFDSMNERLAGCKVKVSSKISKKAGVTLDDCMAVEMVPAPPTAPVVIPPPAPQPTVIVVPTQALAPVPPVAPQPPTPAIVWTSVCTFASKTSCTAEDKIYNADPARPTSVCKVMIESAARAFKQSPGAKFVLVGNRNREESDLLPTARANNVRRQLEAAGVPASAISVQVGSGTTRTVELVLIQAQ